MIIVTERLHIRTLNYYETISRVYSHIGMVKTKEDEDNFIKYSLEKMKDAPKEQHKWYTIWNATGKDGNLVLECGFICPPTEHKVVEVYCYTMPEFQNKGYGTEAIKGLVRFSEGFDIKFVCASVHKENIASQKMMEKAGFYYLTDNKDMRVYNKQIKN